MAAASADKKPSVTLDQLKPVEIKIGDTVVGYLEPKLFSTGSYGLSYCGKLQLPCGDAVAKLQVNFNATVINSNPNAKKGKKDEAA